MHSQTFTVAVRVPCTVYGTLGTRFAVQPANRKNTEDASSAKKIDIFSSLQTVRSGRNRFRDLSATTPECTWRSTPVHSQTFAVWH